MTISRDIFQQYSKLQVESAITCPGQADSDCSSWDHCITISFRCAAAAATNSNSVHKHYSDPQGPVESLSLLHSHNADFRKTSSMMSTTYQNFTLPSSSGEHRRLEVGGDARELVRFVTPFRRRNGHWLTDISPLAAVLQQCDSDGAYIFEATAGGYPWFLSSSLRFSEPYKALVPLPVPPPYHTKPDPNDAHNLRNSPNSGVAGFEGILSLS